MSEILNISQTSQNHDPLSNNSINARICRTKIEKERQKFIEELLFETDPEAVSDQIKEDTKNYVYDSRFQKDFDCEEKNQTNMKRINSDSQSKSPKIKTDAILKISKNHDLSQIVKVVLEENGSQESEPMQISSDLQEELSKAVNRAFELMKNKNGIHKRTDISEIDYVEGQHTSRVENNTNEEEREEGEEVLLRRNITDNMKRAMESSGLSIVVARLKDSEEEYLKSCVNHETPKRITDEETHHHSLTRSTKNKKVPMMGTAALLQKANIDHTDYLIIQDLILSKYSTKIREYLERNHKRRKSRCEHFEEYLLTDQYTPSSISSLDYISSSDGYDSKAFSSLERVHSGKSSNITSSPIIQNQTRSYSINDISKDSQTSCSSLSEPESSRSGCFGDSTKLRPQEVEGIFLQKPGMEEGKLGECMQYLECYGTATSYERKYSHGIKSVTDNIDQISYETSGGQNSEKHSSYMKSSDDLDVHNLANNSICSTYSVSKFIANALDGVNQEHDNSNDTLESASYASPNYTSIDESITTSKISDLLSKESTLTNGRRLIRSDSLYGDLTPQEYHLELEFLTGELSIQNQILLQASKAVKHCRANNILHTTGYIEAERILLLTSETKKALNEEIHYLESKKYSDQNESTLATGEIEIKNIILGLDTSSSVSDKDQAAFLVLVKCGREVHGSRVLRGTLSKIIFDRSIIFEKLTADFKICIEVYSMAVDSQAHHHYNCPSPMDMFQTNRQSKRSKITNEDGNLNVTSAFTLSVKCDLRITDLSKTDGAGKLALKLQNISKDCTIADKIYMTIRSKLELNNFLRGFLTIGTKNEHSCIIWNRRWCMLKASNLLYWNHPSEEEFTPNVTINLRDCTENYIGTVERHLCSRPRTLMLPIKKAQNVKIYFLAADNNIELEAWGNRLNLSVRALKNWRNSDIC